MINSYGNVNIFIDWIGISPYFFERLSSIFYYLIKPYIGFKSCLSTNDILCVVLIRLKCYLSFNMMVPLVGVSSTTIHKYVNTGIKHLGEFAASQLHIPGAEMRMERKRRIMLDNKIFNVSWLIDGWTQDIYQAKDDDLRRGTFSNKTCSTSIKKMIVTDPYGTPYWISFSFCGRPHDMNVCRFREVFPTLEKLGQDCKSNNEYGVGDSAFSRVKDEIASNFISTPNDDKGANEVGRVRHAVENLNAYLELFESMNSTLKMSPTTMFHELLTHHHHMCSVVSWLVKETFYNHPNNILECEH